MGTKYSKYKIFCNTDNQYEYIWDSVPPTVCPVNAGHTVDLDKISKESIIDVTTITSVDSPYLLRQRGLLCDSSGGSITINLPSAIRARNATVLFKKTAAANTVTLTPNGSDTIDAAGSHVLSALNSTVILKSDGVSDWVSQSNAESKIDDVLNMRQLPLAIEDVSSGSVSNTELQYLDGVTSSLQTQLNSRALNTRLIATGTGLTGGGDLSADRSLALAINSLVIDANPDGAADYLVTYDASAATHKRVLVNNIKGISGPGVAVLDRETLVFTGTSGMSAIGSGRRDYGKSATNPVSPTPLDGDKYYNTVLKHEMCYDGFRAKWLSVAVLWDGSGRNGTTTASGYYRRFNGMILTATAGPHVAKGTVIRIGYGTSAAVAHTLEVLLNGVVVASLASGGAASAFSDTINADFNAGILTQRNSAGSATTTNLQCTVYYKLRV